MGGHALQAHDHHLPVDGPTEEPLGKVINSRHHYRVNTIILVSVLVPIAVAIAILFIVRSSLSGGSKKQMAQAQDLMTTGSKARAKILRIDPTGMVVNNINIQCWVTFQLEPLTGGAPFSAQKKILINQTKMPRVGDVWPAWYSPTDQTLFAVGMPDGASPEQIPLLREIGIPHPLDEPKPAAPQDDGPVGDLAKLVKMKADGMLTDDEFKAAKARLFEA